MRLAWLAVLLALAGCIIPRPSVINDYTVASQDVPAPGTENDVLLAWFSEEGYVPGPDVRQSRAELVRRPGDPLVYSRDRERQWWHSQQQTVRDLCVTSKFVYYRLDDKGRLVDAVPSVRSHC